MFRSLIFGLFLSSLCVPGCGPSKPVTPDKDHFLLSTEEVYSSDWLVIHQVNVVTIEPGWIEIRHNDLLGGGRSGMQLRAADADHDGLHRGNIFIVASLEPSRKKDASRLMTLFSLRNDPDGMPGTGGPSWSETNLESLANEVDLDIESTPYRMGTTYTLGTVAGTTVELEVREQR